MSEKFLTFTEVQQVLGLSPDEIRDLMESRALVGTIRDGVVQFPVSQVEALRGTRAAETPAPSTEELALKFLVDEDEERRIEGRHYDGEDLLADAGGTLLAPDEEILEPVDLDADQMTNMELLHGRAVDFGRDVASRRRDAFAPDEDEDILDASKVDLPEEEAVSPPLPPGEAARRGVMEW